MQRLYTMPWYKRLQVNRNMIEGDPNTKSGAIYNYLEHVKNNPNCVNVAQFQQSKKRYATIVESYNRVIDGMINDITNIVEVPIKELKIDITAYKAEYDLLEKEIPKFIVDLEQELVKAEGDCHRAASVIPVEEILDYIVIPIIDFLKKRKLEQYKVIVIRELEKLKLDPSSTWDEIEKYLIAPSQYAGIVVASVEEVYHISELDYCRLLHIVKQECYDRAEIMSKYEAQTIDLVEALESVTDKNTIDYYSELLADYKEARDALLEKCRTAEKVSGTSDEYESLKRQIETLLLINDECVPKEQLEKILNN